MTMSETRPDGGELLARTLQAAGVTDVFALHGGHLESFWQGCARHGLRLTEDAAGRFEIALQGEHQCVAIDNARARRVNGGDT